MYGLDSMIDMGLGGAEWQTPDHRQVSINLCICNPHVRRMDDLMHNVKIINAIPPADIKETTMCDLLKAGCVI